MGHEAVGQWGHAPPPKNFPNFHIFFIRLYDHQSVSSLSRLFLNNVFYVFKTSQKMTFPPSLHPNSFSFPSFDLNIFFLQCKQSSSLLSVESEISKRLEGLKFVNFLGTAPLDPSLGCAVSPSCFTLPLRGLADSTSCYACLPMYLPPPHSHHSLRL